MSKVIITFEDKDSGAVTITQDFEPELDMESTEPLTNAQQLALDVLTGIRDGESFMARLAREERG